MEGNRKIKINNFVSDIDLSYNDLPRLPESLYKLVTLKRLNISNNEITELSSMIGKYAVL